uniref:EMI domain-containing protein n=1 Tax=Anolis carolinensis TaxID=28377 RepID=A0A803SR08_ANOCA
MYCLSGHYLTRILSHYRNWCAYVVSRSVSCVVEDGVDTYVKPDYQPCAWGQLQCSRVLAYRSFLRPRYKVAYKTVSDMEWRCCPGYSGDDCAEGGVALTTPRPPRPPNGRPNLSGFSNTLSGLGGEGSRDSEKVQQLEDKVQRLTKQLQDLQSTLQTNNAKLTEDIRRAVEASLNGKQPADAAAHPEMKETLNEIQRHLQRLDNRISDQENGGGSTGSDVRGEVLREVERRLQGSCASCLAGVEGLQRQQAEDRERMRALEKLVTAVDQRNREAVDAVRQHLGHLAGRMPKEDCCSQLDGRVGGLEHRLDALSDSLATLTGGAGGHGPQPPPWTLDRRMSEIEGRVNTTRRGLEEHLADLQVMLTGADERLRRAEGQLDAVFSRLNDFQTHVHRALANLSRDVGSLKDSSIQLQGALDRVRGSVHACTQICSAPGSQDSQISDILSDLERRVLDNEGQLRLLGSNLHQLDVSGKLRQLHGLVGANSDGLSKLAGEVGELETRLVVSGSAGPPDLARYANHTNRRLERLEQEVEGLGSCSVLRSEVDQLRVQVEACQAACYPSGRRSDPLAGSGGEQLPTPPSPPEEASKPLDGFSVIGGVSGVHLRSLQGELSEVILGFSALNETLAGLQATVEKHQTDLHELGGTKDRIIAEINRVQQEVTEHVSESEERFRGLGHEVQRFGVTLRTEASDCRRSSGSLTERLAKLEGSCEKLEQVSGTLRKVKEGLDKHLTALWGCLRDTNGTLRLHEALLDKIHGNQLPTVHRRLNSLNGSFQALQEELRILSLQDFTGQVFDYLFIHSQYLYSILHF